ncbi:transglutaminase domain-containing protein [Paenibacillus mendelii]|uniref:Transglutaminase domain-containing protein n=1 Tax=Paenibacillus mendelii TaxID=206163 RepID=A0ABV6J8P0_9BACL|nr:transglutaminase domain-containing protein [Paenibacillus mendelii]MCQ6559586.1 transglutaminase [Paenibacillus mendelii]
MYKLLAKLLLVAAVLTLGIGSEVRVTQVQALSTEISPMESLKSEIISQLAQQQTEINVTYDGDKSELSKGIAELLRQAVSADDYIAYIVDSYFYTVRTWGASAKIKLAVAYRETAEQSRLVEERIERVLSAIINPGMTVREKVRQIHDWVVTNVEYDLSLSRYTAYEALTEGSAVCQGYTLLMYRMLKMAGIENRIIEGEVDTGSHVWNLVKIDGQWYHLDATWDDPTPNRAGAVSYNYYLKNDEQMRKDHTWVKPYPASN